MESAFDLGERRTNSTRVVVIGAGIAGSTAALRACLQGARVLLLDKSPDASAGGNTRLSGGTLHVAGLALDEGADRIRSRIDKVTQGNANPALASCYATNAASALDWLGRVGVEFELDSNGVKRTWLGPRRLFDDVNSWPGRGPQRALMTLHRRLKSEGGLVAGGAKAVELIPNTHGIAGVTVDYAGRRQDVAADVVILTDGGFQANHSMLVKHIGPAADRIKLRASPSGTGDAVAMAEPFGAAVTRMQYFYGHLLHRDALTNDRLWPMPFLDSLLFGAVVVSGRGQRVTDEGLGGIAVANELSRQADPREHWIVIDDLAWSEARERDSVEALYPMPVDSIEDRGGRIVTADDLSHLAEAIGASRETLATEIAKFNGAVANHKHEELAPARTRDVRTISTPPYRAIPVVPGITFTMGGLVIDENTRVLRGDDTPIEGLLAAGGSAGGLQGARTGGYVGGLSTSLIFGFVAGASAASCAVVRDGKK